LYTQDSMNTQTCHASKLRHTSRLRDPAGSPLVAILSYLHLGLYNQDTGLDCITKIAFTTSTCHTLELRYTSRLRGPAERRAVAILSYLRDGLYTQDNIHSPHMPHIKAQMHKPSSRSSGKSTRRNFKLFPAWMAYPK